MTNISAHLFVGTSTTMRVHADRLGGSDPFAAVTLEGGGGDDGHATLAIISEDGEPGAATLDRLAAACTDAAGRIRAMMADKPAEAVQG